MVGANSSNRWPEIAHLPVRVAHLRQALCSRRREVRNLSDSYISHEHEAITACKHIDKFRGEWEIEVRQAVTPTPLATEQFRLLLIWSHQLLVALPRGRLSTSCRATLTLPSNRLVAARTLTADRVTRRHHSRQCSALNHKIRTNVVADFVTCTDELLLPRCRFGIWRSSTSDTCSRIDIAWWLSLSWICGRNTSNGIRLNLGGLSDILCT
jgi:hypothetical protein